MIVRNDRSTELLEARRRQLDVDALLLHEPNDIRWACGFTGSNALLLWGRETRSFVTDGRYRDQAAEEVRDAEVHVPGYDLIGFLGESGPATGMNRVAYSDGMTVRTLDRLRTVFPNLEWVGVHGLLADVRASKAAAETAAIVRAQALSERVLRDVAALVRPGMTERDVAAEITVRLLRGGADGTSFDPIVAAGERSALPHARPTDREIRRGEPVLVDFGAVVDGYASDMTRMLCLGPPPDDVIRVHAIVCRALDEARSVVRTGAAARDVDAAARRVIEAEGLGPAFPHSLGHGVGLDVHEEPAVSWRSEGMLPGDAVITLEPGIYLGGRFGIRIEDLVRVSADGAVPITTVPYDIIVV